MEEVTKELVTPQEMALPEAEQFEPVAPMEEAAEERIPPQEMALPEAEQFEPVAPMEETARELVPPRAEGELLEEVPPTEIQPEVPEVPPELPPWLAGVEQQLGPTEEEPAWMPPGEAQPEAAAGPVEVPPRVEPFQPIEPAAPMLDLNEAGLADLERIPGVGYTRALAVLTYRQAFGPFGSVDELVNVAGFDETLVDTLKDRLGVGEAQPVETVGEAVDIHQVTLIQARNALIQGNTQQAASHYSSLIKAQQFVPEVLQDLNEALYRFPVDVSIWETLGDVHMRSGHLQDALDAYTKAEELIR